MIILWMVYAAGVSVLLAIAGWSAERVARASGLPVRWVWVVTLALTVVLPVTSVVRAGDGVRANVSPVGAPPHGIILADQSDAAIGGPAVASPSEAGVLNGWIARAAERVGPDQLRLLDQPVASLWAGLTCLLLLLLASTVHRARSMRRKWPVSEVLGHPVRVAPGVGPAVLGFLWPEIVVPRWLLSRPASEIQLALAHEREHVRAGDPRLLLFGSIATVLLPWNPVAWWMHARLRLAVEIDCDRRVVSAGVGRFAYGSMLLDIADRATAGRLRGAMGLIGAPSHLEKRIEAMTSTVRFIPARVALFSVAALAALIAACDSKAPTAAQIEAMDLAAVEATAVRFLEPATGEPIVVVDGVIVDPEYARSIPSEEIQSIRVVRGDAADAPTRSGTDAVDLTAEFEGIHSGPEQASQGADAGQGSRRDVIEVETRAPAASDVPVAAAPQVSNGAAVVVRDEGGDAGSNSASPVVVARMTELSQPSRSQPLIVVDGVIVQGASVNLEAMDIESIEVVKGSAAVRLYGSRATQGVINIRTMNVPLSDRPK